MLIPFNLLFTYPKKIKGIIHVGAHELEELEAYLKKNIYNIIWIEANPDKYDLIEKKINSYRKMALGRFAAGSKETKLKLNISNNGRSSSILKFGTHKKSYPSIKYLTSKIVNVMPIDQWIDNRSFDRHFFNFVNIDIQGYELEALKGLDRQLQFIDFLYLEVNFRQVYEKCSEVEDIDKFLKNYNFKRVGMFKTNKGWGDAIYVKRHFLLNKIYYIILIPSWRLINLPFKILKKLGKIFSKFFFC